MVEEEKAYSLSLSERRTEKETRPLVGWLFKSRLWKHASLVLNLLQEPVADVASEGRQIGILHPELQQAQCGTISHSRWLAMAHSLVYM